NQVLALVKQPDQPDRDAAAGTVTLVLDDIQDPGNLGTMLRIADWFDVDLVVCSRDCADRFNPKVVQATMGSILRVPAFYTDLLPWLNRQTVRTYAAVLEGRDVTRMEKLTEGIILIGNESRGIRPDLLSASQVRITIPRKGRAESLNAAVAAGIILSHLT
ncbi:MAG TPA: RNA methyltransferase, partial [Chitinophagaceae bacterium]|nr:RNA methyltransferase [Chitinophagaceae bacterium]